jgi:hypothetical protein
MPLLRPRKALRGPRASWAIILGRATERVRGNLVYSKPWPKKDR